MKHLLNRNDPCYCGSGKKYKKCHMLSDEGLAAGATVRRYVKDGSEIAGMRTAGAFNGELMDYIRPFVRQASQPKN